MQNKELFEIIMHIGRVTSLQSWVAKKSCHGQTLQNECSISNFEDLWIISFMLHISVITSPQTDTYINKLVEIFLKLSMKIAQVHLIIWTTLVAYSLRKLIIHLSLHKLKKKTLSYQ